MAIARFNISATPAYAGTALTALFFSPVSYAVYLLVIVGLVFVDWQHEQAASLVVALATVIFFVMMMRSFVREKLSRDAACPANTNLACLLSYDMIDALASCKAASTAYDLLAAALETKRGKFIIEELGMEKTALLARGKSVLADVSLTEFLEGAAKLLPDIGETRIAAPEIILLTLNLGGGARLLLNEADLSDEDVAHIIRWEGFHYAIDFHEKWYMPRSLRRTIGSVGRTWVAGYTDVLNSFTIDLSNTILSHGKRKVILHTDEINALFHIMSKPDRHNALVLGDVGSGRQSLIENAAFTLREYEITHFKSYTRILMVDSQQLISSSDHPDRVLLHSLDRAGRKERFIFVIKDIGMMLKSSDTRLKAVVAKFLNAPNISIVGLASNADYHALIKTDTAFDSQFEKIFLRDPNRTETIAVLMEEYCKVYTRKCAKLTYKGLVSIVELTKRYMPKGALPGKAVEVMHDALIVANRRKDTHVTDDHVRDVISAKQQIDITELSVEGKQKLLDLKTAMKQGIVGQEHAIEAVVNALKRGRLDIRSGKRPIGTYLFLGPTGVGKTQTAKILAKQYFGSTDSLIRIDLNEYGTEQSASAIIGMPSGGEGYLTQRVQDKPFSLILLDEIEKAHPIVLNLFLQILDEGQLIDSHGQKTDFRNTIIIATSNAGALFIRDAITSGATADADAFKKKLVDQVIQEQKFAPEFINRFDDTVVFYPLTEAETKQIAMMMIKDVVSELQKKRGVTVSIEEEAVTKVAKRGYSPEFGAREMRRAVTDMVETYLADFLLVHDVNRGDEIVIAAGDLR